jgi:hypothetical protein
MRRVICKPATYDVTTMVACQLPLVVKMSSGTLQPLRGEHFGCAVPGFGLPYPQLPQR